MSRPALLGVVCLSSILSACPTRVAETGSAAGAVSATTAAPSTGAAAPSLGVFGPVKAGAWYSADRAALERRLDALMDAHQPAPLSGPMVALISPHAGVRWSGETAAAGYAMLRSSKASYRRVVVLSPSHTAPFDGFSVLSAQAYRTPLGDIPLDAEVTTALRASPDHRDVPHAWPSEHAVEMQLPFLQRALSKPFKLVPILVGGESSPAQLKRLASALTPWCQHDSLVVVSSDFTHFGDNFGYHPFRDDVAKRLRTELAEPAIAAIESKDAAAFEAHLNQTGDTICGRLPIKVLLYMQPRADPVVAQVGTSGEKGGDYSSSVTYVSLAFVARGQGRSAFGAGGDSRAADSELTTAEKKRLLEIARASLTQRLTGDGALDRLRSTLPISTGLALERGAFVTINRKKRPGADHAELRGCIGYMTARAPLHQQVADLAIAAGLRDHRFSPMTAAELDQVEFEISILSPMKAVASYREIEIGRHGMTIEKGGRRAVFLPQVAPEYGWGLDETLTHLAKKAGLPGDGWREGARFKVFTADVFAEH